jgi:hypothetical protein
VRFYAIRVTRPNGSIYAPRGFTADQLGSYSFTSFVNNQTIPAAWDMELDVFSNPFGVAGPASYIKVYGVAIEDISQSNDLVNSAVELFVGMKPGLPLATEASKLQSGVVLRGNAFQVFGNWVGTEMTLDFVVSGVAKTGQQMNPQLVLNWPKGTSFKQAVTSMLSMLYPDYNIVVDVSRSLVSKEDQHTRWSGLDEAGPGLRDLTAGIVGHGYPGVQIFARDRSFYVSDGTSAKVPKVILFQDMIGQPTWIEFNTVQVRTVMRADISWGDFFKFDPRGVIATTRSNSQPQVDKSSIFKGSFKVNSVHHVGRYRDERGDAWCSIIEGTPAG